MDADLQNEARKAVAGLDLAAWERVRVLMLRAGAAETETSAIERTRASEEFLMDVQMLADSVLLREGTESTHLHGGAKNEAELIRALLNDDSVLDYPARSGIRVEYIKSADVAIALNRAFGITGWSLKIESLRFLNRPYRVNELGVAQEDGQRWNAVAISVVELTLVGPGGRSCKRQHAGVGQAPGGRARSRTDAVSNSISEAVKNAFKGSARFLGQATGLTLQLSGPMKQEVRAKLEADLLRAESGGQ